MKKRILHLRKLLSLLKPKKHVWILCKGMYWKDTMKPVKTCRCCGITNDESRIKVLPWQVKGK